MPQCSDEVKRRMIRHLWDLWEEQGGLCLGDAVAVQDFYPVANIHEDPENFFYAGREQWREAREHGRKQGLSISGLVHSHPPPDDHKPTDGDWDFARKYSKFPAHGIFDPATGVMCWYNASGIIAVEQWGLPLRIRILNRVIG